MSTISSNGKVAYVYEEATDTWHPVSGTTNTAANFTWTGDHVFSSGADLEVNEIVFAKKGINNFLNPSARDSKLGSSPSQNGIFVFLQQDANGSVINQIQYSHNGTWHNVAGQSEVKQISSATSYNFVLSDAGKTLEAVPNSGVTMSMQIPTESSAGWTKGQRIEIVRAGEGVVSIAPASGVTLTSKNNNRQIAAQWSAAVLYYRGSNAWVLIGDLTASA